MDMSFEPLSLVIGVTGHRDLRPGDIETLKAHVETIFDRLEDEYANPSWFLERKLRGLLPALANWFKDRRRKRAGATPMIVLSALAEGADQLVAQIAYDRGLPVIAPLPLPVKEYRRDFELQAIERDAAGKFDDWIRRAADEGQNGGPAPRVRTQFVGFATDNMTEQVNTPENVRDFDKLPRDLQYRHAGQFIARHCDVLIALWDGEPSDAIGGTAEIVSFKRNIPLEASGAARACLDAPEMGPVIHIVTPRVNRTGAATDVDVKCWGDELIDRYEPSARTHDAREKRYKALEERSKSVAKQYDTSSASAKRRSATAAEMENIKVEMGKIKVEMGKLKEQIDPIKEEYQLWKAVEATIRLSRQFNYAAARLRASPEGVAAIGKSFSYLFDIDESRPETKAAALQGRTVAPRYCSLYAFADALAIRWQMKFRRDWFWLFALGLTAFGCFEAYSHLAPIVAAHQWPGSRIFDVTLLTVYIASFAAIAALYFLATRWEHQEQFLDYRALAEALRVTVFWRLVGIRKAADAYPIRMPRELAWVKTCLLVQELLDTVTPVGNAAHPSLDATSYLWIRNIWIKGEGDYFERTRQKHQDTASARDGWSRRTLSAVAVLTLVLMGLVFSGIIGREHLAHEVSLFAIGFLPGLAAVLVGYSEKLAFSAQARQCERMADVFRRAFNILPEQFDPADAKLGALITDVVRELGRETMRDNAEWVSTYRERPFSLPQS